MTEKEIKRTIVDIMEAAKRDVAGYADFAGRNAADEEALVSAACYSLIKSVIEDIRLATDDSDLTF